MPVNKKPTTIPAIHPNIGVEKFYFSQLMKIIKEIRYDVKTEILNNYKDQSKTVAMDGAIDWLEQVMDYLMDRWNRRLNNLAEDIAQLFVNKTVHNYDAQFKKHLRKAGFTVRFKLTPFAEQALQASLGENVGLIKSIGTQYLSKVEGHVFASVRGGFDLVTLTKNLQHDFGATRNRAALIARDQGAKAHAVIERARRKELGITKAVWLHSGGGKEKRLSHVAANNKVFEIDKGMWIDNEWILPSEKINCRCVSRSVIDGIIG